MSEDSTPPRKRRLVFPFERKTSTPEVQRHVYEEQVPTQVMNLMGRLVGTPFESVARREYASAAESIVINDVLNFALKLGETMFRFGAGTLEVETSIIVVTSAFGIRASEVDINNQSITLNYAPPGSETYTLHRVVRSWSQNYAGLSQLHRLVSAIGAGEVDLEEAKRQVDEIRRNPKPFPWWVTLPAAGIFSAVFVMFIGGTPGAGLLGFFTSVIVMSVMYVMALVRVPEFFSVMAGGLVATALTLGIFALDWFKEPSVVVAGAIMMLLPTGRLVSAVQDGINGFPMTASGRMLSAFLAFTGLVSGIMLAVVIADIFGAPTIDLTRVPDFQYPMWAMITFVFVAAVSDALVEQSEMRLLFLTGIVSVLGYLGFVGAAELGVTNPLLTGFAATIIGFFGRLIALNFGAPQLVLAVPSILFLLPGLMIFRSMYEIAMNQGDLLSGMSGVFGAAMMVLAIGSGTVLGDTLARPLTKHMQANERRRLARR